MEERTFVFHISSYDVDTLLPQLSKALEARSEFLSRERYPEMWNATDKLNAKNAERTPQPAMSRAKSILFLLVGIFLLVPGLVKPQEMLVLLLFGLIGVIAGIRGLLGNRAAGTGRMKRRFDASAKQMLAGKDQLAENDRIDIMFSEAGMTIPAEEGGAECVGYDVFEIVVEASDLYLLVFDTRVTVLQKCDLQGGDFTAFRTFLGEKVIHMITVDELR